MQGPSTISTLPLAEGSTLHSDKPDSSITTSKWRLDPTSTVAEKKLFKEGKQEETLSFNSNRRLIITIIGAPQSGKKNQAAQIEAIYGIASVCFQNLFVQPKVLPNLSEDGQGKADAQFIHLNIQWVKKYDSSLPTFALEGYLNELLKTENSPTGFSLANFPLTPDQCRLYETLITPNDLHIPICLDVEESVIAERIGDNEEWIERNEKYNENKASLLKRFQVEEFKLTRDDPAAVTKMIVRHIDSKLDEFYEQEKRKSESSAKEDTQSATVQKSSSATTIALTVGGFALGVICTYFFIQKKD